MVVIKYVPYVADSKRAMDEYTSEIFMGGRNTIVMHNTCEVGAGRGEWTRFGDNAGGTLSCYLSPPPWLPAWALGGLAPPRRAHPPLPPAPCVAQDSLLAAPIIMDLVILAELVTRIQLKRDGQEELRGFHPVAVLLSYLTKVGGGAA